ncbi:MAG: esterase family protein [Bacteroidales bacterium]|nr:esterase family protein [Bacteroidales bacterium]
MRVKRILICLALLLPALSARAGKVVTDSLQSVILGSQVKYNVYLPDSFGKTDRLYPVVYLLHGLSDDYQAWTRRGNMQTVVDELVGTGEAAEMVIVMPNAGGPDTHHTWNGYFNMPGWNYEDFFFREFLPKVEAKYRVVGDKGHRAVMGLSMGGGGSVVYAQRHPDMFSSCYSMSAWLDNKNDEVRTKNAPKDCLYYVGEAVRSHSALDFLDNADEATLERLRSVAWFIDCGDDDFLLDLNVAFHQKMRSRKVKSELRVRNGVHNWEYWHLALRLALPFASRNFDR